MMEISLLKNTIQEYAWGSTCAIPDLLGEKNPYNRPQAELWMGAHPRAPSRVRHNDQWNSLLDLITQEPVGILGEKAAQKFNYRLPFLFKVLAAAKPLSIQAHPNRQQAQAGYKRENSQSIPLDAPNRNYRDDNHKPECICALTRFWALSRFRKIEDILAYMAKLNLPLLKDQLAELKQQPNPHGLQRFYTSLMSFNSEQTKTIVNDARQQARKFSRSDPVFEWLLKLADAYPRDIGVLAPIFLNLVCLEPGQALFLDAGELHAYLEGLGIELMANSDNVLRGGLTPKHVDVPELLQILNFKDQDITILKPEPLAENERIYPSEAAEFVLSVITLNKDRIYMSPAQRNVEIIICTQGEATITDLGLQTETPLPQGTSAIVPAAVTGYRLTGEGICYKAGVPL